ncbi:hypothetical protein M426DRAFT_129043 [Hypoxylon sp. CI-4A]|nr:hypothetical protein M426DRAFT_129043 [Hypoxylon sp. CI-4A]
MRLPLTGPIFRQTDSSRHVHDDNQALLEDDPLSIQLQDYDEVGSSTPSRPRLAARSFRYKGPKQNWLCQLAIFIIVLAGLLLAILLPRKHTSSSNIIDGLLPCGEARYSINEVSPLYTYNLGEVGSKEDSTRAMATVFFAQ